MSETVQQAAAIGARGKTIVSASAGSGKTRVMVKRYCEILLNGEAEVSGMLAVTFTNEAAAQMRERIRGAILEGIKKESGEKRELLVRQLRALPLADICTVDSFCGRLIRTYFHLLGIDPGFRIAGEGAESVTLSDRAMTATLEDFFADKIVDRGRLLSVYYKRDDGKLRELIRTFYAKVRNEADYRAILEEIAGGEDLFSRAADVLAGEFVRRAKSIAAALKREQAAALQYPEVSEFLELLKTYAEAFAAEPDLFRQSGLPLYKKSSPSRDKSDPVQYALLTRLQALSKDLKEVYREAAAYRDFDEERRKYLSVQGIAEDLAALTLVYDGYYEALKRDAGVLDYGDLEHLTLKLMAMSEVRASLKEKYKFVFVDEYQDVNPMQERLVSLIAGEDVFLVGDRKQAIYGFRGSKSVYFAEKEGAFRTEGNFIPLDKNFRSAPAVLEAVNAVFGRALGGYQPMEGGAPYGGHEGEVLFHRVQTEKLLGDADGVYSVKRAAALPKENATAKKVADLVEEEVGRREGLGKKWFDTESGTMRQVRYGDIAVLVRYKQRAAVSILQEFARRGIPVVSAAEINICDYPEIKLILRILSYLDNPEQDIPLAAAMLSVLGGFNERDLALIRIKCERTLKLYYLTFRDAVREYYHGYREGNDPLAHKIGEFYARMEHYRSLAGVRGAAEVITALLADGLEAQIAAAGKGAQALSRVRRLVSESVSSADIHEFLRKLKANGNKIVFTEAGGEDAVHVMTVHASKGLEFPVVILTEVCARPKADSDDLYYTDALHLAPKYFDLQRRVSLGNIARDAAHIIRAREAAEGELNLLYVGMTRARYRLRLIIDGALPAEEDYDPGEASYFAEFIPPEVYEKYIVPEQEEEEAAFAGGPVLLRPDPKTEEEIVRAARPYPFLASTLIPVKDSASGLISKIGTMYKPHGEEYDDTMSEYKEELSDMDAAFTPEIGTAYHAFLEKVEFGRSAQSELLRMQEEGLLSPQMLALLSEERLERILGFACLSGLAGKKLRREQRFLVKLPARDFPEYGQNADDEIIFQGAIDLLVEDGDGFTVVDYKFSALGEEKIREKYAVQIRLYRMAVAKVMGVPLARVQGKIVNIARLYETEF